MERFDDSYYTAVVRDVTALCRRLPLANGCRLVIDVTGVGRALIDLCRSSLILGG